MENAAADLREIVIGHPAKKLIHVAYTTFVLQIFL